MYNARYAPSTMFSESQIPRVQTPINERTSSKRFKYSTCTRGYMYMWVHVRSMFKTLFPINSLINMHEISERLISCS